MKTIMLQGMMSEVESRKRGRPRQFEWVEFKQLSEDYSSKIQFLKLASVNNSLIASLAVSGCPQCASKKFRLRHDIKHNIIRFYCSECKHETSFRIKKPPKSELQVTSIYDKRGMLVGEKLADTFHEPTKREKADAVVLRTEQNPLLGGEWFDGTSGVYTQNRYLTLEEALERIARRKMRAQMEANLREIEEEEKDNRLASFEADVS